MASTTAEILTSSGDRDGSYEWATPADVFEEIARRWGPFDLDAAASDENYKVKPYLTEEDDALSCCWSGRVFLNPPYGRDLGLWVQYAWDEVREQHAEAVVLLIPARTDTRWWHDIVMKHAYRVCFVQRRIKFEMPGKDNSATFPNVIVVLLAGHDGPPEFESWS